MEFQIANNPDWQIVYSCGVIGSTAFTMPVCSETVSSLFPRKLSPRSLNTVASSKIHYPPNSEFPLLRVPLLWGIHGLHQGAAAGTAPLPFSSAPAAAGYRRMQSLGNRVFIIA